VTPITWRDMAQGVEWFTFSLGRVKAVEIFFVTCNQNTIDCEGESESTLGVERYCI
jgi:hypothetical protein